jgi:hypothetical protein
MDYYLDRTKCGYLSPEIQERNLKLFGYVTSEEFCRQEHDALLKLNQEKARLVREERRKRIESGQLKLDLHI